MLHWRPTWQLYVGCLHAIKETSGRSRICLMGDANPKGAPAHYLANFHRKLHENEENWTKVISNGPKIYYVDPPLENILNVFHFPW